MSFFSRLTGHDAKLRERQTEEQTSLWPLPAARQPICTTARSPTNATAAGGRTRSIRTAGATLAGALPDLRQNGLQMTREDAIRRGISTGDLGTSNEGDVVSSWGRNLANCLYRPVIQRLRLVAESVPRSDHWSNRSRR
jgi:hypothetical protein